MNVWDLLIVQTIVARYVIIKFRDPFCNDLSNLNTPAPGQRPFCLGEAQFEVVGGEFDAQGLFNELKTSVFDPAKEAQAWVNEHECPGVLRQRLQHDKRFALVGHDHRMHLGGVLRCLASYEEPERLCRRSLDLREQTLGSEHFDTLPQPENI